jgi:uncharacterized protein YjiS (DUF1127 family)
LRRNDNGRATLLKNQQKTGADRKSLENLLPYPCRKPLAALQQILFCSAEFVPISGSEISMNTGERNSTMLMSIVRFLHAWKRYGAAVHELTGLSDRELADIGITRSDIPRLAWDHARR